ncbi:MAG: REP-associated tyrosine transposase [Candidatus Acidiferrales bacterium]
MGRLTHRTTPGCTYFVTTKTWENRALLQSNEAAGILIECFLRYREKRAYLPHEFVIMPNHLHLLITPARDHSLEKCMQLIKGGSSNEIHQRQGGKLPLWQSGFHEEAVRDANDYRSKMMYIRMNPVHAHLVENPDDWAHSTASGHFALDPAPNKFKISTSGAKAHLGVPHDVGAKAPTP